MAKDTIVDKHPSYGLLQFNRVTGSPKNLFGTHLHPQNFIEMKVVHGERLEHDGREDYYGKETILRVWMSANQFSECITGLNVGMGVPCTIRQIGREEMPYPPTQVVPTERIQSYFELRMKEFGTAIREQLASVSEILNKDGAINKKDREALRKVFERALQEIEQNIPFFLNEYEESAIKIVTHAKTEFDAFVSHAAMRIGLEKIAESGLKTLLPELEK